MSDSELTIQMIGCMVEAFADDDGNIDMKCFEKIFNACVKALLVSFKVGDSAVEALKQVMVQVRLSES